MFIRLLVHSVGTLISISEAIDLLGGYITEFMKHGQYDSMPDIWLPSSQRVLPLHLGQYSLLSQLIVDG